MLAVPKASAPIACAPPPMQVVSTPAAKGTVPPLEAPALVAFNESTWQDEGILRRVRGQATARLDAVTVDVCACCVLQVCASGAPLPLVIQGATLFTGSTAFDGKVGSIAIDSKGAVACIEADPNGCLNFITGAAIITVDSTYYVSP